MVGPLVIKCLRKRVILLVFPSLSCLIYRFLNRNFQRNGKPHLLCHSSDKSLISNYRPISLLSAVGEVFERIVLKDVFNHLISNNLLYKFQSGFIPGHSSVHQLIEIYYRICMSLDDHCIIVRDSSVV